MLRKIITFSKCFVFASLIFLGCGNTEKRKAEKVMDGIKPKHDIIIKNGVQHFYPDLIGVRATIKHIFPVP